MTVYGCVNKKGEKMEKLKRLEEIRRLKEIGKLLDWLIYNEIATQDELELISNMLDYNKLRGW